jgi:hypothetical protein
MLKDLPVCFLIRKSKLQYVQFDVPSKIRSIDRRMPQIPNFQLRISKMCLYINLRNCPLECAGIFFVMGNRRRSTSKLSFEFTGTDGWRMS